MASRLFKPSISPVIRAAEEIVRARLQGRDTLDPDSFLAACALPPDRFPSAKRFMARLGKDLAINPYRMRPDDSMSSLFRVSREEIPRGMSSAWDAHGLGTHVQPLSDDLMWAFSKATDAKRSYHVWKSLDNPPQSDEEWANLFMSMTVGEFVRFTTDAMN